MPRRPASVALLAVLAVLAAAAALAGCGSSKAAVDSGPTPVAPTSSSAPSTPAHVTPSVTTPSSATPSGVIASGAKSPTCVNGWIQPAPGTDFYTQATQAFEQSQGGTGYVVKAVRYFAGPLSTGGIGAVYYLDLNDARFRGRVVLVSGAGPAQAAVAAAGTTGWKAGEWTGFRGTEPAASHPPLPGKWGGPEFDAVTSMPAFLSAALADCLDGS